MLIAEIRRKLPSIEDIDAEAPDAVAQVRRLLRETKEDLLTADVFGVLKYLPRRPYLESVLTTLAKLNRDSTEFQRAVGGIRANIHDLTFEFWPSYRTPEGLGSAHTEPDVQISGPRTLLLFEAKLGSGFGERQLERELAVAAEQANGRDFFVILVTPGSKPPRFPLGTERRQAAGYLTGVAESGELPTVIREVLRVNCPRVLWLSWESIQQTLQAAHQQHAQVAAKNDEAVWRARDMLSDLAALPALRQIPPFGGFAGLGFQELPSRKVQTAVFFQLPSELQRVYRLADAVAVMPKPFGWWRRTTAIEPVVPGFVPIGRCCKGRRLGRWNRLFVISQAVKSEKAGTNQEHGIVINLGAVAKRWALTAEESGFQIKRSTT